MVQKDKKITGSYYYWLLCLFILITFIGLTIVLYQGYWWSIWMGINCFMVYIIGSEMYHRWRVHR